jgi:hypothetical protein
MSNAVSCVNFLHTISSELHRLLLLLACPLLLLLLPALLR